MSNRLHHTTLVGYIRHHRHGQVLVSLVGLLSTVYVFTVITEPFSTSVSSAARGHSCRLPRANSPSTADVAPSVRAQPGRSALDKSSTPKSAAIVPNPIPQRATTFDADVGRPLDANLAPSTIFFVWCAARFQKFEFRHYLSVRSAIRVLRPDSVWFYYAIEPVVDRWSYGTWLNELNAEFPFFARRPVLELGQLDACDRDRPSDDFIVWLVSTRGGFYVDLETVVVDFSSELRSLDAFVAYDADQNDAIPSSDRYARHRRRVRVLMAKSGRLCDGLGRRVQVVSCVTARSDYPRPVCVDTPDVLQPRTLWSADGGGVFGAAVGRSLRTVFYGDPEVPKPVADYGKLVPKIGHMIWIGGGKMKFSFFLSLLSLLHCADVDVVYVHGNRPPGGIYWKLLLTSQSGRVKFVQREDMKQVYGQSVQFVSHESDVWRADILLKYGGVYLDADAVVVQPLTESMRAYEAVAAYDWPQWYPPFPEVFNLGVTIGKPGARFWSLCLESMKSFRDYDFSWNGLRQPYRIFERHPDLLHVDPRLQVICFMSRCHPTWWPDYHNEDVNHVSPPAGVAALDWRNDTFSFHFTNPTPAEFANPSTLLSATGMFAEIGQHVLRKSRMVDYFRLNWTGVDH